ncbi:MAG: 2-hydroxyacyl-CoA dehydratase family protein [Candidatus Brocadiia bacterium]
MMTGQYDDRYRLEPQLRPAGSDADRAALMESRQRQLMADIPVRPSNIGWFEAFLAKPAIPEGAKAVGYFCQVIPLEIICAFGAVPLRIDCGNSAYVQPGEELLSADVCPLAKASFAQALSADSTAGKCACLVLPSSCDAKRKLGEVLADFRPTFTLNLPPEQDYARYGDWAAGELERMAEFFAQHLGAKLSSSALLSAVRQSQRASVLIREILTLRSASPAAMSSRDLFAIVQSSFNGAPSKEWLQNVERVRDEVAAYRPPREVKRPRVIITGAPLIWPNFKVLNLLEESGAYVVGDTICTGSQSLYDPPTFHETSRKALMRALAQRYIFASPCPCFVSQGTRMSRILDLVEENKADGVVHYGLRLCQLFDMEVYRLSRLLKERNIPFLNVHTDYSPEDSEQLRIRVEAFVETLHGRAAK